MSMKRGTSARGFRGVGRLAGLGYAQELVFRSRTKGEQLVSEMRWDCRELRAKLRSAQSDNRLAELVSGIVSVSRIAAGDYPERFFEVELSGIVRLRSDKLMSPTAIGDYLLASGASWLFPRVLFRRRDQVGPALRMSSSAKSRFTSKGWMVVFIDRTEM